MVGIVRPRPVKKIKRWLSESFIKPRFSSKVSFKTFVFFVIWFFFLFIVFYILKQTLFKADYYIKKINYSADSVSYLDDPYLYRSISKMLKSENFYVLDYFKKGNILSTVQKEFPIVKDLVFAFPKINTIAVKIDFFPPDLLVRLSDRTFAVYQEYIFPLKTGSVLSNSEDILTLELPQYLSWTESIAGLFFEFSQKEFLDSINTIKTNIEGIDRIVYIPWSSRIALFFGKNKVIYINMAKDIKKQIDNLLLLKKFYVGYEKLTMIDLWSLDDNNIIVR